MIPQILMIVAPLVSAADVSKQPWLFERAQLLAAARAKIPKDFLSPELTPEQVQEYTQYLDELKKKIRQRPRPLKIRLMDRIRKKRKELALLEQQVRECEIMIASEKSFSVQLEGETLQFLPPHVETCGPLEQMLRQILAFSWYTKPEASGYQTDQAYYKEIIQFERESSKFRYKIGTSTRKNGDLIPYEFTAVINHVEDRLAKIHYIQKILDDHALLQQHAQAIEDYLDGKRSSVTYPTHESNWVHTLHGAMKGYKGPVFEHPYLDGLARSVFFLRERISRALRELPLPVLAAWRA